MRCRWPTIFWTITFTATRAMKPRLDGLLRVAGISGAGAIWGLALARLAAEAGLWPPLYESLLAIAGVASVCTGLVFALWRRTNPPASCLLPLASLSLLYVTGIIPGPLAGCVLLIGGGVLALLAAWGDRAQWTPPAILGLATFAIYTRTLLPSLGQADTFEFQVIIPRLGVAHPTGYPLYILLGKLFTLLPLGNVAWRVNVASAIFAAAAVLVVYAILLHLTSHWLPAFLAALTFAFSATFWSQAIVAEVYALHNLLAAIILWLLLKTSEVSTKPQSSPARRWQIVFFLIGLSLTNHLTTALLLPAVALGLLWDRPRLQLKDCLIAGGLLLLGLSLYLFIPLRWPALNHGEWMTLRGFVAHITGGQFHAALRLDGWRDPTRWAIVGRLMREPFQYKGKQSDAFSWIGLGLAAVGVTRLALRQRRALALTGATFLAFAFYGLCYHVPDISVFLLPAHLVLALWIGVGIASLARLAPRFAPFAVLLAMLPLNLIWTNLPQVDQSHNRGNLDWGQYALSLPLAENSAVLADSEKFAPLYYLQQIEGARPDLDLVILGSEELYQAELTARLGTGQTVYLARYLPHLEGLYLRSVGPLVEVRNQVFAENLVSGEKSACFGEAIRLLDAQVDADPLGRVTRHLTLYWQAETEVSGDFVVRLRLVDADDHTRWESDGMRPVNGLYPTNGWPVGVTISDYHEIKIPPWLPRGEYKLQVGLFPPFPIQEKQSDSFSTSGLQVGGATTDWFSLSTLELVPSPDPPSLPREQRYLFTNGAWLTGYDMAGEAFAGAPFVADLAWQGVEENEQVRLTWVDQGGQETETSIFPLTAGALRSRHTIAAPQNPGRYTLRAGLTNEAARCNWLASPTNDCPLGAIEVADGNHPLANFADLALLLEAEIDQAVARPGETVPITLRWRALRSIGADYTTFVHLVGPDGRLHGQVDAWPVQGSYPTSQWTPGEEITDPYQVQLTPDAPAGRYRIEVGWYLLATMQRLQIVDTGGRPTGDAFIVGEFDVQD
ncbi:MAG: hypothetical protein DRJ03_03835 [Chloroflexi bacterium]|nr:MAG: hypothetical protein DRJ03_03835 [Chloroflexota bacterium]